MRKSKKEKLLSSLKKGSLPQLSTFIWSALYALNKLEENPEGLDSLDEDSIEIIYSLTKNLPRYGWLKQKRRDHAFIGLLHEGLSDLYRTTIKEKKSKAWLKNQLTDFLKKWSPSIKDERIEKLVFDRPEISTGAVMIRRASKEGARQHTGGPIEAAYYGVARYYGCNVKTAKKMVKASNIKAPSYSPLQGKELQSLFSSILRDQRFECYGKDKLNFPESTPHERQHRVNQALKKDFEFVVPMLKLDATHQYFEYDGKDDARKMFGLDKNNATAAPLKGRKK